MKYILTGIVTWRQLIIFEFGIF